ncbi:unnamed protein product [Bursaphelenchus xylophilus]|uniref:(pine wood nematode) hypothetical protein n=1 Tax=Bursaphelenchus xylophilus TaxID=6326 RepID=A0A1I7RHN6_BURXY|nr:unnamed protein product [Bursaphelenchus xylophilus]CAG9115553.1 unnamed protein product [Bursaphelenchus xylophilus]
MYSVLHETDPSTTINASVVGHFLHSDSRQLVTIGGKYLRMFRLNPFVYEDEENKECKPSTRLECVFYTDLMSVVKSVAVARIPSHPQSDSLLLSFDDAKLSIVNFNPATQSLNTLSLHSYEDEILKDGFTKVASTPIVRVDPVNRCAAMLVYGRHLAILPFYETTSKYLQSYTLSLRSLDVRLENIIDMVFLHGYYEPTLLLVYEPLRTTAGRAVIRYDTVCILAVSLNLKDQLHAVVWNLSGLPMTINQAVSIPQPVGGVCLFGANEIVYLNQSVPPCGISLNSNADDFCRFPLNDMKSMKITLDACSAVGISESELLVASRKGKLYYLKMDVDISNAVRSVRFEPIHDVSLPYTLSYWDEGIVFLGSRLGDSQLLRYSREHMNANGTEPVNKQSKMNDEEDDEFLYGGNDKKETEEVEEAKITLKVEVLHQLLNVGPCKGIRSCNANTVSNEFKENPRDFLFDLVTLSGHEQNSSLCFFQRTVRPIIQQSDALGSEAAQLWTVGRRDDDSHKYLIVSYDRATSVLEISNDNVENVEQSAFFTKETTIYVGELLNGRIYVQICSMSIVLISDDTEQPLDVIRLDSNFPVASASVVDPFVLLLTQNGKLLYYRFDSNLMRLVSIDMGKVENQEKSAITAACIYKDCSGLFRMSEGGGGSAIEEKEYQEEEEKDAGIAVDENMDDEDALLYGESVVSEVVQDKKRRHSEIEAQPSTKPINFELPDPNSIFPAYWVVLARENGHTSILNAQTLQQVYFIKKLQLLPEVIKYEQYNQTEDEAPIHTDSYFQAQEGQLHTDNVAVKAEEVIMELQFNGLGYNKGRPVLSLLIDDTVVFYEVFSFDEGVKGALAIRLKKIPLNVVTRSERFVGASGRAPVETGREVDQQRTLVTFYDKIGSLRNGLFVGGFYPSILVSEGGRWYLHPMTIDGPVFSLSTYHNDKISRGFIYLTGNGNEKFLRFGYLDREIRYDTSYPVRKVQFEETVNHCVYLMNCDVFAVVTSVGEPNTKVISVLNEDKHVEEYERDGNCVIPDLAKYKLQLFSTEDWKFVPNSTIEFQEFEVVTCAEEVLLSSESTVWGVQSYLALGTALNYGEEVYVRGRILIYELIEVVPEEGMPTTRHKMKVVYDKEQKGPVTSMCHCDGYLLTGMGQKIFIWQFKDGMLNGVSFLDMHFYIHSLVGFGSLALACDMFHSLSLVQYQKDFKALSMVARDLRSSASSPMAAQFILDRTHMAFVLADEAGNILIFNHLPETNESNGGEKLILRSALNIGTVATGFVRVKGHMGEPFLENPDQIREIHTCVFATLEGSFGIIRPISEKAFRRLQMLQQIMTSHIPQPAGLNPRGSKALKPLRTHNQMSGISRFIVDANLVFQYQHLNQQEKADLAKNVGSSRFQIMDDITELRRVVSHF